MTDPFAVTAHIEYFTSDSNGLIKFPHTKFSIFGVGNTYYTPAFSCEGTTVTSHAVYVESKVKSVSFAIKPPAAIEIFHPAF